MEERLLNAWVGVDVGKELHWAHVLDASERMLLSRRVENDEADLLALIDEVLFFGAGALRTLLQEAGTKGTYLLVGHSLGSLYSRVYTDR